MSRFFIFNIQILLLLLTSCQQRHYLSFLLTVKCQVKDNIKNRMNFNLSDRTKRQVSKGIYLMAILRV